MKWSGILLFLFTHLNANTAEAAIFVVGNNAPECTHQSLSAAIAAAKANGNGLDSIYVTDQASYIGEPQWIDGHSVWIIGGFTDCTLSQSSGNRTIISGHGAQPGPALRIEPQVAPTSRQLVLLSNLSIRAGTPSGVGISGGGVELDSPWVDLTMTNMEFTGNNGIVGGGLQINGGVDTEVNIASSVFTNNTASAQGGGLSCLGGAAIRLRQSNTFHDNFSQEGGGIYLEGCTLEREGPLVLDANVSEGHGAGVAIVGGGRWWDLPDDASAGNIVTATAQIANERGGGFYVSGAGSELWLRSAQLMDSQAKFGAAIAAVDGAGVAWFRHLQNGACSNNVASFGGSCLYLNAAISNISNVQIAFNQDDVTAAIHIENNSIATMESLVVHHNEFVINSTNMSHYEVRYSTFVDNAGTTFHTANGSTAAIFSTINVSEPNFFGEGLIAAGADVRCVLSDSADNLDSHPSNMLGEAQFINRGAYNYRLDDLAAIPNGNAAQAIDFCTSQQPLFTDFAGHVRGYQHPGIPDHLGSFDLGAYENQFESDLIFTDTF